MSDRQVGWHLRQKSQLAARDAEEDREARRAWRTIGDAGWLPIGSCASEVGERVWTTSSCPNPLPDSLPIGSGSRQPDPHDPMQTRGHSRNAWTAALAAGRDALLEDRIRYLAIAVEDEIPTFGYSPGRDRHGRLDPDHVTQYLDEVLHDTVRRLRSTNAAGG